MCIVSFFKSLVLPHFAFLHAAVDAMRKPPASPMRLYICCRCAIAHHHCVPFQACLLLFVHLCVVRSPISSLGSCAGINQQSNIQTAGAWAQAAQIMLQRIKKGQEEKIKESMPPLPGQTLHLKKRSLGGEKSFSQFYHHVAFTGMCFHVKDSAVSHVQLIRNQRLWLISENESQHELLASFTLVLLL